MSYAADMPDRPALEPEADYGELELTSGPWTYDPEDESWGAKTGAGRWELVAGGPDEPPTWRPGEQDCDAEAVADLARGLGLDENAAAALAADAGICGGCGDPVHQPGQQCPAGDLPD